MQYTDTICERQLYGLRLHYVVSDRRLLNKCVEKMFGIFILFRMTHTDRQTHTLTLAVIISGDGILHSFAFFPSPFNTFLTEIGKFKCFLITEKLRGLFKKQDKEEKKNSFIIGPLLNWSYADQNNSC